MSFVGSNFKYDIFISYGRGDAQRQGDNLLITWMRGFVQQLEAELNTYPEFDDNLRICFDEHQKQEFRINPVSPMNPAIRKAVQRSAMLAIIMTPHYLASDWCKKERETWIKAQKRGSLIPEDNISVIRALPTKKRRWPADLLDQDSNEPIGFHIYDRTQGFNQSRPYGWPSPDNSTGGEFRDALVNYAGWLRNRLNQIRSDFTRRRHFQPDESADVYDNFLKKTKLSKNRLNQYLTDTGRRPVLNSNQIPPESLRSLLLLDQLYDAGKLRDLFRQTGLENSVTKETPSARRPVHPARKTINDTVPITTPEQEFYNDVFGKTEEEEN